MSWVFTSSQEMTSPLWPAPSARTTCYRWHPLCIIPTEAKYVKCMHAVFAFACIVSRVRGIFLQMFSLMRFYATCKRISFLLFVCNVSRVIYDVSRVSGFLFFTFRRRFTYKRSLSRGFSLINHIFF